MRASVCVVLLAVSATLPVAGCSSFDGSGDITHSVFTNGKQPVEPQVAEVQPDVLPPAVAEAHGPTVNEAVANNSGLNELPAPQRAAVRSHKPAPAQQMRKTARTTPPASPAGAGAPAKPAVAKPPAASAATAPPSATPAPAPTPETAAAKPPAVKAAQSRTEPPKSTPKAESQSLSSPWPQAPTAGSFTR